LPVGPFVHVAYRIRGALLARFREEIRGICIERSPLANQPSPGIVIKVARPLLPVFECRNLILAAPIVAA
jgi:hypothetical protein